MKDGLAAALAAGASTVASVHADGQYSPEALGRLLRELEGRGLDLLQGSRIASGTALSGRHAALQVRGQRRAQPAGEPGPRAAPQRLPQRLSGIRPACARRGSALPALSDSFDFDLEVMASARAAGLRVGEAPIPTHYGDEVSHLRPLRYGLRVLRVLWRYRRGHYGRPSPSRSREPPQPSPPVSRAPPRSIASPWTG